MVPESHDLAFPTTVELSTHIRSAEFKVEILDKLKTQHVVDAQLQDRQIEQVDGKEEYYETFHLVYTRNNAGGLKDAIDFLLNQLVIRGLDTNTIRGALPRPKSDSFEDNLPFFESKLLQRAGPGPEDGTDSPTRSHFGDDEPRGMLDRLRKPGSMSFTNIFNGRKNTNSPGSLFKHASSNASKATATRGTIAASTLLTTSTTPTVGPCRPRASSPSFLLVPLRRRLGTRRPDTTRGAPLTADVPALLILHLDTRLLLGLLVK
jgi:hypothetical protein